MKIDEYRSQFGELSGHALILEYVHQASKLFPVNYVEISPYRISDVAHAEGFIERRRVIHQWCNEHLEHQFKLAYMNDFTALMCENLEDAVHFKLRWC